ncbi:MAG: hypothetical protein ABEJ84_07555 [Halodesulfurarchaeum sp.]
MRLTQPEEAVKSALTEEVEYEEHFIGHKAHAMAGSSKMRLYSLEEVLNFIHVDDREKLLETGSGGTIGYVDFGELADWTKNVLGDDELASAIIETASDGDNYKEQAEAVSSLINERLEQARED